MKVFAEEFGSTAERETAINENQSATDKEFALGEWKEQQYTEKLNHYLQIIQRLKKKKNKIFQDIFAYALSDLIKNHKITLRADKKKSTTMSIQESKRFDLETMRKQLEGVNRSQLVFDLLVSVKDRLNEHFDRNALIV